MLNLYLWGKGNSRNHVYNVRTAFTDDLDVQAHTKYQLHCLVEQKRKSMKPINNAPTISHVITDIGIKNVVKFYINHGQDISMNDTNQEYDYFAGKYCQGSDLLKD